MTGQDFNASIIAYQADPLVKQYFPRGLKPEIFRDEMYDEALSARDLDELAGLGRAELAALVQKPEDAAHPLPPEEVSPEEEAPEEALGEPTSADDCVRVLVSDDGLVARIMLVQPPQGVPSPSKREILRELSRRKVKRGIRFDFIERLAGRPVYNRMFRIAEGQPPVDGEDGKAVFHFASEVDLAPKLLEDGTADYKDLDFAQNVQPGELLCERIPPTEGIPGVTVYGTPIPASSGRPTAVTGGLNTLTDGTGVEIRAACGGEPCFRSGQVLVSPTLTVDNVDNATGNINFVGSVNVRGDVVSGFTVQASGDIVVRGVVENAILIAGGNIVLCRGMKGQESGHLDAQGDIRSLFIETAKVRARGNVFADSILNSTIECGGALQLYGKHGCLVGGNCTVGDRVEAVEIGNNAGMSTFLKLGGISSFIEENERLALEIYHYLNAHKALEQIVAEESERMEQAELFPYLLARAVVLRTRFNLAISEHQETIRKNGIAGKHTVHARETLYPNVYIEIDGQTAKNSKLHSACTIRLDKKDIIVRPDNLV